MSDALNKVVAKCIYLSAFLAVAPVEAAEFRAQLVDCLQRHIPENTGNGDRIFYVTPDTSISVRNNSDDIVVHSHSKNIETYHNIETGACRAKIDDGGTVSDHNQTDALCRVNSATIENASSKCTAMKKDAVIYSIKNQFTRPTDISTGVRERLNDLTNLLKR